MGVVTDRAKDQCRKRHSSQWAVEGTVALGGGG